MCTAARRHIILRSYRAGLLANKIARMCFANFPYALNVEMQLPSMTLVQSFEPVRTRSIIPAYTETASKVSRALCARELVDSTICSRLTSHEHRVQTSQCVVRDDKLTS